MISPLHFSAAVLRSLPLLLEGPGFYICQFSPHTAVMLPFQKAAVSLSLLISHIAYMCMCQRSINELIRSVRKGGCISIVGGESPRANPRVGRAEAGRPDVCVLGNLSV